MKRAILILIVLVAMLLVGIWFVLPFKLGALSHSISMSPESIVLVRAGSGERLAEHLRGVADYVATLGSNLKIESYSGSEQLPFSRFVPFPHSNEAPYLIQVTFSDERGDRYTAIFSGEIGFEISGLTSPRYISSLVVEKLDSFLYTVFRASPSAIRKGQFERFPD